MKNREKTNLKKDIRIWLKGYRKLAIIGVGNPLRKDDAVGLEIVKLLSNASSERITLLACEMTPENCLGDLEDLLPTHVLIIDAAYLGTESAEARILRSQNGSESAISTHVLPLTLFCRFVKKNIGAKIMILGIQPKCTEFGEGMSVDLRKAAKEISQILMEIISADTR